jgi:inner membrane protein
MASAFGHAAVSLALNQTGLVKQYSWRLMACGVVLSVLPDADSVGFTLGVPYGSFWGHRGFSHSILFAVLISIFTQVLLFRNGKSLGEAIRVFLFLFLSCVSHSILDAMTTGGLGVAFFSPFDNARYFLPFRPIKVSPISINAFFNGKGWAVIQSESIWIGIPCILIIICSRIISSSYRKSE